MDNHTHDGGSCLHEHAIKNQICCLTVGSRIDWTVQCLTCHLVIQGGIIVRCGPFPKYYSCVVYNITIFIYVLDIAFSNSVDSFG